MYPSEPDSRMPGCGGTSVFTSTMSPSSQRNESESFGKQLPLGSLVKQPMIWPFELMPFYYLCSILDGFSRFLVHWDLRESMREVDIEVILARAKEKYSEAKPRIISDNGPQFIARDFKEFIRISGMTHVRTSPSYPQSNGKLERWHKSLKSECIRPGTPLSLEDAKRLIQQYVDRYNNVRLHSAIGYVTPMDMLAGRQVEIHTERDRKLEAARQQRQSRRQA